MYSFDYIYDIIYAIHFSRNYLNSNNYYGCSKTVVEYNAKESSIRVYSEMW